MDPSTNGGSPQPVLAYFGHHKCASTWIWEIVDHLSWELGLRHHVAFDDLTPQRHGPLRVVSPGRPSGIEGTIDRAELGRAARAVGADFVSCPTADRGQLEALGPVRGFHVIRDPRDILVSAYFSHRNSHPTEGLPHLAEHRARLRGATKASGLLLEMEFSSQALRDIADWDYGRPEILEFRMEDLVARPYESFLAIFEHLGLLREDEPGRALPLLAGWLRRAQNRLSTRPGLNVLRRPAPATGELLLGTVYAHRFDAHTGGRRAGTEDTGSHYRKGVAGDWVHHFDDVHVDAFNELFGDLLVELGYEPDRDRAPTAPIPS